MTDPQTAHLESLILPQNQLLQSTLESKIKAKVIEILQKYDYPALKNDLNFLLLGAMWVEHLVDSNTTTPDKIKMVVDIFTQLFGLTDDEQKTLTASVQFLYDNQNIQKMPCFKIVFSQFYGWLKKKVL